VDAPRFVGRQPVHREVPGWRMIPPNLSTHAVWVPCLIGLSLFATSASARADEPAKTPTSHDAPVKALSLHQAIALAFDHNPDFRSTGYDVVAAEGAVVQASVLPNPSFAVSANGALIKPLSPPLPNSVSLGWTIPIGGKISAATQAAQATLDATKATRIAAKRQLQLNVQTAFVTAQLNQALLSFAEQDKDGFHKELDLNELRYKDGKIAFGDLLKLRIQAVATDDEVREAALALENARADLRHIIGEDVLAADFTVEGELALNEKPNLGELDALLDVALKKRPDYLALLEQEKSAKASLVLARRTPIPDIGISADYNFDTANSTIAIQNPPSYDISLSIPVPLFDRNQGNITSAEAAYEKSKLAEQSLRIQIRSDLSKALQEWKAASELLAVYQTGVVAAAKESLEITKHAYELGTGTLLDFLDAEASYRQIESAYRSSIARASLAAQNIQFVTGEAQP